MQYQKPNYKKKQTHYKKPIHFHFDTTEQVLSDQQNGQFPVQDKLKRQTQMFEGQQQRKLQKKIKPDFTDKQANQKQYQFNENNNNNKINKQPYVPSIIYSESGQYNIEQYKLSVQNQAITLLKDLLFHPNFQGRNNGLINTDIVNKWILDDKTHNRIKSCLILYMILYKFDEINWYFSQRVYNTPPNKTYLIQNINERELNQINQLNSGQKQLYNKFRQNQFEKYLIQYVEWFIYTNQKMFLTSQSDPQFWALALNHCEEYASKLINTQNTRDKAKNIFLALYLLNAQDSVFKSTIQIPIQHKNIMFMKSENLQILPKCHWLLGLNISLKYFYTKQLNKRIKQSLNPQNIEEQQIQQFYIEYFLLQKYFNNLNINFTQNHNPSLTENILKWILMQSQCMNNLPSQNDKKQIQKVTTNVSLRLLQKGIKNSPLFKDNLLIVLQLFQREKYLSDEQKDKIITNILYLRQRIAIKHGSEDFSKIIDQLEHKHETVLGPLFQRLTLQYNNRFKHQIRSNNPALKDDLLTQLKHLASVKIIYRIPDTIKRIHNIFTDFNIISHWNKKGIVTRLVIGLENYIQTIKHQINNKNINTPFQNLKEEQKKQYIEKISQQLKELSVLNKFLKITLKLNVLTFQVLKQVLSFIENAESGKVSINPSKFSINYIKQSVLSEIFSKSNKYEQLIIQICSQHPKKQTQQNKVTESGSCLSKLQKISQQLGIQYFMNQISILKNS